MLSDADRKKAADILMAAQKERKQAVQLHVTFPDITLEDSYAISTDVMQRKVRAGQAGRSDEFAHHPAAVHTPPDRQRRRG